MSVPAQDVALGLGIYGDLASKRPAGDVAAGASLGRVAAGQGAFGEYSSELGAGATDILGGLEVAQGLKQGGVSGYGEAAIGAGRLGLSTGLIAADSPAAEVIPGLGAGLGVYNFAKNWRSGATGSDALSGAEAGASIGALLGPLGALAGLGIGAAVGAVSSIFGPGKTDPENVGWDQYAQAFQHGGANAVAGASPSQNFQMIAGIFDSRGSNIPFYNAYGRMGENKFFADMTGKINEAVEAGHVPPNAPPAEIYSKVVEPWITAMGGAQGWQNTSTIQGAPEKQAVGNVLTQLIGQYQSGEINASTQLGIGGQTVNIQPYAGATMAAHTAQMHGALSREGSGVPSIPGTTMATAAPQYQSPSIYPEVGALAGLGALQFASSPTGSPPMTGTGGATSPGGVASPATSPIADLFGAPTPGDPLSGLGQEALLGGLGIYGASQAAGQNASLINPALQAGSTFTNAGESMLGRAGQLTPLQGSALSTGIQQGASLIQAATPVGQAAQQLIQQFQSGNLKPGDQAQLDQQVASAKAQMLQQLGPNVDSTTAQTYLDQIDQQAQITKQTMLNSYLATGDQAFDTWAQTTEAGQQTIQAAQNQAVQNIDTNFQEAFGAGGLGSATMLSAIDTALKANNQLGNSLSNYMSNLTRAYALAKAGGVAGAAAGAAGAGGAGAYAGTTPADIASETTDINSAVNAGIFNPSSVNQAIGMTYREDLGNNLASLAPPSSPVGTVDVGQPFGDYSATTNDFAGTM